MTRINCVPPEELCRQHLVAEYRELPRVFGQARASWLRGDHGLGPAQYCLGPGHVRFFYRRQAFLRRRHTGLATEMRRRGYRTTIDCSTSGVELPGIWQCDWEPSLRDMSINRDRLAERLPAEYTTIETEKKS